MELDIDILVAPAVETSIDALCKVTQDRHSGQNSLLSLCAFSAGDVICSFGSSTVSATPNYLTVQIGDSLHIELSPQNLQYMNHSCDPNCFFDTSSMEVIALRDIRQGEEMSFFYPSTEWSMAQPFTCFCDSKNCLGVIAGAEHLPKKVLKRYRLSDYISSKLSKRK